MFFSPANLPTVTVLTEVPKTLTVVRTISIKRSMAKIGAISSTGSPTAFKTIMVDTRQPDGMGATPKVVKKVKTASKICMEKSTGDPDALTKKAEVKKTNKAVPVKLTEVARGVTKLVILLDTLAFFSRHSIVIGSVAEEEVVEKAVTIAGSIAL